MNCQNGKAALSSRNSSSAVREPNFTLLCAIKGQTDEKPFSNLNYHRAATLILGTDESVSHSKFKLSLLCLSNEPAQEARENLIYSPGNAPQPIQSPSCKVTILQLNLVSSQAKPEPNPEVQGAEFACVVRTPW